MDPELKPLINSTTRIRVSSTLDKSVAKKHLTDGSPETCWTSQQGLPQFIHITFDAPVTPRVVHLTFQGGFAGKRCSLGVTPALTDGVAISGNATAPVHLTTIYPEDVNRKQTFALPETTPVQQLRLTFDESSDFFGRITIYDLQIEGLLLPPLSPSL